MTEEPKLPLTQEEIDRMMAALQKFSADSGARLVEDAKPEKLAFVLISIGEAGFAVANNICCQPHAIVAAQRVLTLEAIKIAAQTMKEAVDHGQHQPSAEPSSHGAKPADLGTTEPGTTVH